MYSCDKKKCKILASRIWNDSMFHICFINYITNESIVTSRYFVKFRCLICCRAISLQRIHTGPTSYLFQHPRLIKEMKDLKSIHGLLLCFF